MRSLPEELAVEEVAGAVADGWSLDVETLEYAPVGGGSYHWIVTDAGGARYFANVDDLDRKPWLGDTRGAAFDGLRHAFDTAAALRAHGLAFVCAPVVSRLGETSSGLGSRYTVAIFPFLDGQAGAFGHVEPADRAALGRMLAELHGATSAVASHAMTLELGIAGRQTLDDALRELDRPWTAGPFSEPARRTLALHAPGLRELLDLGDRLAKQVADPSTWVVTHGEPHAGNLLRTADGLVLVDWDTVALAPPERDLWWLRADAADEPAYLDATGHRADPVAMSYFRLAWDLEDAAAFTSVLRAPHRRTPDTEKTYDGLSTCVAIRDRWSALL